jgi:ubiquinone/menaquinone biosynthesis C-methylase UbiE
VNRLTARFYDRCLMRGTQEAGLADARRDALAQARGDVLEIGAGTGLNIPAYPRTGIARLVLTEPHEPMRRQIEAKLGEAPAPVEIVDARVEELPFPDATFDTVTGTLVLCEAEHPAAALDEIARVLKPGGHYLFLEHVRSDDPKLARSQDRWAPLWKRVAGGCNCNRDTLATIAASGLDVETHRIGRFPKSPKVVSPLLSGSAVRGDVL